MCSPILSIRNLFGLFGGGVKIGMGERRKGEKEEKGEGKREKKPFFFFFFFFFFSKVCY